MQRKTRFSLGSARTWVPFAHLPFLPDFIFFKISAEQSGPKQSDDGLFFKNKFTPKTGFHPTSFLIDPGFFLKTYIIDMTDLTRAAVLTPETFPGLPLTAPQTPQDRPKHSKGAIGNISEAKAHVAALERGWDVFVSLGNDSQADRIFEVGKTLFKIQVKTASFHSPGPDQRPYPHMCCGKKGKKGDLRQMIPYGPRDFDFLIAVMGWDFWIIPIDRIAGKTFLHLTPKYDVYRNAWDLLEKEAVRRSRNAIIGSAEMESVDYSV